MNQDRLIAENILLTPEEFELKERYFEAIKTVLDIEITLKDFIVNNLLYWSDDLKNKITENKRETDIINIKQVKLNNTAQKELKELLMFTQDVTGTTLTNDELIIKCINFTHDTLIKRGI